MSTHTDDAETLYDESHEQDLEAAEWDEDNNISDNDHNDSEAILLKRSPAHTASDDDRDSDLEQLRRRRHYASRRVRSRRTDHRRWFERIWMPAIPTRSDRLRSSASKANDEDTHRRCRLVLKWLGRMVGWSLMIYGLIQLIFILLNLIFSDPPSNPLLQRILHHQSSSSGSSYQRRPPNATSHWPTDFSADIVPVHCHSHNDYWRPVPLFSAIEAGCTGVEADVWQIGNELYVGHSVASLTKERTFRSLYVSPLVEILDAMNPNTTAVIADIGKRERKNGVFDTDPDETLVLLVDFKPAFDVPDIGGGRGRGGSIDDTWRYVMEQLEPLRQRGYLSYFDGVDVYRGAITVVATGEAPFHRVVENTTYRDVFYDAPLDELAGLVVDEGSDKTTTTTSSLPKSQPSPPTNRNVHYDPAKELAYLSSIDNFLSNTNANKTSTTTTANTLRVPHPSDTTIYTKYNSFYASTSFYSSIGLPLPFLRDSQRSKIRRQVTAAHEQGLKARYWETPGWPVGLRNYVWRELMREGVDYLNVDDVWEAARGDWGWRKRGWLPYG